MLAAWCCKDTEVWSDFVDLLLKKTDNVNLQNGKGMKSDHFLISGQYVSRYSKRLK